MTEEEQIQYALALSRGEEWPAPAPDANGNHKFTESTQNGHVSLSNRDIQFGELNGVGVDEPDNVSETKLAEYAQLGEHDQILPVESSKTGELQTSENGQQTSASSYHPHDSVDGLVQSGDNQWETIPLDNGQWGSNVTSPNGGDFAEQTNGDSGFVSPDLNGHLDGTEVSLNKDSETSKLTSNDSAIELDKENQTPPNIPPKKSKGTDFSNVIDLCGDEGKDVAAAAAGGTDAAGNGLTYAELKAKEEEDLRRTIELSLQGKVLIRSWLL